MKFKSIATRNRIPLDRPEIVYAVQVLDQLLSRLVCTNASACGGVENSKEAISLKLARRLSEMYLLGGLLSPMAFSDNGLYITIERLNGGCWSPCRTWITFYIYSHDDRSTPCLPKYVCLVDAFHRFSGSLKSSQRISRSTTTLRNAIANCPQHMFASSSSLSRPNMFDCKNHLPIRPTAVETELRNISTEDLQRVDLLQAHHCSTPLQDHLQGTECIHC